MNHKNNKRNMLYLGTRTLSLLAAAGLLAACNDREDVTLDEPAAESLSAQGGVADSTDTSGLNSTDPATMPEDDLGMPAAGTTANDPAQITWEDDVIDSTAPGGVAGTTSSPGTINNGTGTAATTNEAGARSPSQDEMYNGTGTGATTDIVADDSFTADSSEDSTVAATGEQPGVADQGLAQPQQGEDAVEPLAQDETMDPIYGQETQAVSDPALADEQMGTATGTETFEDEPGVAMDDESIEDRSDSESDESLFADEEEEDDRSTVAGSDGLDY